MIVNVYDEQSDVSLLAAGVRQLVRRVIRKEKVDCTEVNIYFVDTPTICQLHADFFDDASPTDCISFPMDSEDFPVQLSKHLGEVFVCPSTAKQYVAEHGGDVNKEVSLYIIHGLLHLIGYDDIDSLDIEKMRLAEKRHLDDRSITLAVE